MSANEMKTKVAALGLAISFGCGSAWAASVHGPMPGVSRAEAKRIESLRMRKIDSLRDSAAMMLPENPQLRVVTPLSQATEPGTEAVGDALRLTRDDTLTYFNFGANPEHEYSLEAPAGTGRRFAFRFESDFYANFMPVQVNGVRMVVDNAFGAHNWPEVAFYGESPANPLVPDMANQLATAGALDATGIFAGPPAVPGVPDEWQAVDVDMQFTYDQGYTVDDGLMSDLFDRADEALDNPNSDWLECNSLGCDAAADPKNLQVVGNGVDKTLAEEVLGIKVFGNTDAIAAGAQFAWNYGVSVDYDVSAAGAQQAGVMARVEFLDGFYYAVYDKASGDVVLGYKDGMNPDVELGRQNVGADTGTIQIDLVGHPSPRISVSHNGNPLFGSAANALWLSPAVGLYSPSASSGERWDNFQVLRVPYIYAVVTAPDGVDARLPGDISQATVSWNNLLVMSDSTPWELPTPETDCKPANGFMQLRVEDTSNDTIDQLFNIELSMRGARTACTTCPTQPALCTANQGPSQQNEVQYVTGELIDVYARIWIDHAQDFVDAGDPPCNVPGEPTPVLFVRLWEEPGVGAFPEYALRGECTRTGALVQNVGFPFTFASGQNTIGGPGPVAFTPDGGQTESPATQLTPQTTGVHCIEVCEAYTEDCMNAAEVVDERPLTNCIARFIDVTGGACDPTMVSTLVPNCFRAWKERDGNGDLTGATCMRWTDQGLSEFNFDYTLNLRETPAPTDGMDAINDTCFDRYEGIFDTQDNLVDGGCPVLPPPASGGLTAFTLYQDEGCGTPNECDPTQALLPDDSMITGPCR